MSSSSTSVSLSILNMTQQVILIGVMLASMLIAGQAVIAGQMTLGVSDRASGSVSTLIAERESVSAVITDVG